MQLSNLSAQRVHILLDDVRQFVDLLRAVVEDGLPLGQQGQLLQLGVRVGDVTPDAARNLHEVGGLPRELAVVADAASICGAASMQTI